MDFQHCYKDKVLLERLKDDMNKKLYPPRFRIEVVKKHASFFSSRQYLRFRLTGGERNVCRDVAIATGGISEI